MRSRNTHDYTSDTASWEQDLFRHQELQRLQCEPLVSRSLPWGCFYSSLTDSFNSYHWAPITCQEHLGLKRQRAYSL